MASGTMCFHQNPDCKCCNVMVGLIRTPKAEDVLSRKAFDDVKEDIDALQKHHCGDCLKGYHNNMGVTSQKDKSQNSFRE